jgi:hypothetical protein
MIVFLLGFVIGIIVGAIGIAVTLYMLSEL